MSWGRSNSSEIRMTNEEVRKNFAKGNSKFDQKFRQLCRQMKVRRLLVWFVFGLLFSPAFGLADPAPLQPDILLIMPDQWRGDCLGVRGHPAVRTPTIDALAKEGA